MGLSSQVVKVLTRPRNPLGGGEGTEGCIPSQSEQNALLAALTFPDLLPMCTSVCSTVCSAHLYCHWHCPVSPARQHHPGTVKPTLNLPPHLSARWPWSLPVPRPSWLIWPGREHGSWCLGLYLEVGGAVFPLAGARPGSGFKALWPGLGQPAFLPHLSAVILETEGEVKARGMARATAWWRGTPPWMPSARPHARVCGDL